MHAAPATIEMTIGGREFLFTGDRTYLMGVINVSPESVQPDSIVGSPAEALDRAHALHDAGASIIDLGAQSSWFDVAELDPDEEIARLLPTLDVLVDAGFVVSVDSWKAPVMRAALDHGAALANDTGGLADPAMLEAVAAASVPAIAMSLQGEKPVAVAEFDVSPATIAGAVDVLRARRAALAAAGVRDVILDPGTSISYPGDGLEATQAKLELLRRIPEFRAIGAPVLAPIPRKRPPHRMYAFVCRALEYGADILRVHDVADVAQVAEMYGRLAVAR